MKEDNYIRWTNKDMVYKDSTKRFELSFDVEYLNTEVDDKGLILLAVDCLAAIVEENGADPQIFFDEVLKLGRRH